MKISYLSIILIHLNPPCSSFTQAKRKQSSSSWWQEDTSHYRSLYLSRYYINVLPGITFFWDPWSLFHGSDIFIPQNWVGWNIPDSDIYPSTTKVCFKNLSFSKPSMDSRDRSSPKSPFSENQYYYPVKLSNKKRIACNDVQNLERCDSRLSTLYSREIAVFLFDTAETEELPLSQSNINYARQFHGKRGTVTVGVAVARCSRTIAGLRIATPSRSNNISSSFGGTTQGAQGPAVILTKLLEKMQTALVAFTLKFIPHLPRHCGRRCVWERLFETIHPGKTVAPVAKHQWPVGPSEKQPVSFCINLHLWTTHGSIMSCSCVCSGSLSRCFPYTCFTNYY